jgi:kynureninase
MPNARACGGEVDGDAIYFCGNSLGLLSKKARQHMQEELDVWSTRWVSPKIDRQLISHSRSAPSQDISTTLTDGLGSTSIGR